MGITEADINEMLLFLLGNPDYQQRFRSIVLAPAFADVPQRMDKLEGEVEVLLPKVDRLLEESARHTEQLEKHTGRFDAVDRRFDAIDQRFDATDQRLDAIDRRFDTTDQRMDSLTAEMGQVRTGVNKLTGEFSNWRGKQLESKYIENLDNWFGRYLPDPQRISSWRLPGLATAEANGLLAREETEAIRALDLVVRGRDEATIDDAYLAVEISSVIDVNDVRRAVTRAELLRKLKLRAQPFVGGRTILQDAAELARRADVIVDLHPNA